MIVADSGMQMTPQGGYLEGFDRVLAMSGRVARAFLLEPFFLGKLSPNLHQPLRYFDCILWCCFQSHVRSVMKLPK